MHSLRAGTIAFVVAVSLVAPSFALAQSTDLEASIRTRLMQDPRTSQLSHEELDAMVSALAANAEREGMQPKDINPPAANTFAPAAVPAPVSPACIDMPQFVCAIEDGLGLDGSNVVIPLALFACAGLLAFLLYELKHHHRVHGYTGGLV